MGLMNIWELMSKYLSDFNFEFPCGIDLTKT